MTLMFTHDVRSPAFVVFSDNTSTTVDSISECPDLANVHFHGSKSVCTPRVAVVEVEQNQPKAKPTRKGLTRNALGKGRA